MNFVSDGSMNMQKILRLGGVALHGMAFYVNVDRERHTDRAMCS